jgi:hypothetical protein
MLYVKYIRAKKLHVAVLSGDDVSSGALEGRYESVSEYMKRLITTWHPITRKMHRPGTHL